MLSISSLTLVKDSLTLNLTKWQPNDQQENCFAQLDQVIEHVSEFSVHCCPKSCELIKYLSERQLQKVTFIWIHQDENDTREDYQFSEAFFQVLQRVSPRTSISMKLKQLHLFTSVLIRTKDIADISFDINQKKIPIRKLYRKFGTIEKLNETEIMERDVKQLAELMVTRRFQYKSLSLTFKHLSTLNIEKIVNAQAQVNVLYPTRQLQLSVIRFDEDIFRPENHYLIKSINALRQVYKYPSGKYLRDYFTLFACKNKSIKLDKFPDLSNDYIMQYMDMLDFTDDCTKYIKFDGLYIENYSILVIKLIQNCKSLEKIGTYRRTESGKDSIKQFRLSQEFELPKGLSKTLKEILIIGELTTAGNAFYKCIIQACSDTITQLQLLFDVKLASSFLTHVKPNIIENLEIRDIDDAMYEQMKHMKKLKSFQTTHYGSCKDRSEDWKEEGGTASQQTEQEESLLYISPQDNTQVKRAKEMINLLRSWPMLEKLHYYWNYDFSVEIAKLKSLKYLQPSGQDALKSITQIIRACQNKPSGFQVHSFSESIKMEEVLQLRNSITECIFEGEIDFQRFLDVNKGVSRDQLLESILRQLFVPL
ncbi:hypothetical protein FGO68_gene1471 [Halteria grandinella]|uniref:Uncharacterized protein n=1 Tax=Halteria grandinella TaxID=5974 RepID=A0A8J8NWN3_HALGN|nr:hypothetical protein FGO68_gene1471 [Halteria grandinella]